MIRKLVSFTNLDYTRFYLIKHVRTRTTLSRYFGKIAKKKPAEAGSGYFCYEVFPTLSRV